MHYTKINQYDIANAIGIHCSIFFNGCTHGCVNCFNKELWNFNGGKLFDESAKELVFKYLSNDHCDGLSILGGEPLQQNHDEMLSFITEVKYKFPNKKIWLWTGYYLTELNASQKEIINLCDVVVDGRFEEALKDVRLRLRGSSNQTIWENRNGEFIKSELNEIEKA